ncbi:MAG: threonine--tRNA ligase [Candidatus Anstonellales archaeon]
MKLLTVHCDFLEFEPISKALATAEEVEKGKRRIEECLVCFIGVERGDEGASGLADSASEEIRSVATQVKSSRIVLYPWVHLTQNPANPNAALKIMKEIESIISKWGTFEVHRAPFGWYKSFEIKCKGHPLSELSRDLKGGEKRVEKKGGEAISASLSLEDKILKRYYILDETGNLTEIEKFDFSTYPTLKKFAEYEMRKVRAYEKEPPHIKMMHEHNIADSEPGSDSGNLRWYPNGRLIKRLLETAISQYCINYGAMEVETPIMYDFEHPTLKKYLNRFPARQYVVQSDDKNYFLRFAACFGQFLIVHDTVISYRILPLKIFELTRYSFRREQTGEVTGLKRLRAFTMPDMHTLCADMESAKKEFTQQFEKAMEWIALLGLDLEVGFRIEKNFWDKNKEWVIELTKKFRKPFFVEMFDERYAYFIAKFEFNFVDSAGKAAALSTVQIDVENADNYDIAYTDSSGRKKRPIILHASISGSLERVVYALLESAAMKIAEGKKAMLPLWLAPTQVRVIPLSEKYIDYALAIADKLSSKNVRVDVDDRQETFGKKIREAEREWIPYIAVVGEKEIKENKIAVTIRKTAEKKMMEVDEVAEEIHNLTKGMPFEKLSLSILLSKRPIIYQMQ